MMTFAGCDNISELIFLSSNPVTFESNVVDVNGVIEVYTPGWDTVSALANAHSSNTTIVWANPFTELAFLSDPVSDGAYAYIGSKPFETN